MKLSSAAGRVVSHLKQNNGFISLSYARTCMSGVNELLDAAKITHHKQDDIDGFRLLGYRATQEKRERRHGVRRFLVGEGGINDYNGAEEYK